MIDSNDIQLTKQAIQLLIDHQSITQIIYVDDYFEAHFDVEVIIGWLHSINVINYAEIEALLPGISLNTTSEIWTRQVRDSWEGLSSDKQKETAARISAMLGTRFYQDFQVANKISDYFPRRISPRTLSPSEWIDQKEQILSAASPQSKILCMFDQDLSEAKGFQGAGPKSGMGLIKEIISQGLQEMVICCLLTHTISSIENEIEAWRSLAKENEIALFQFLPLAKIRLADDKSPLLFADGIKKAMLNLYCEKWKQEVIQIINHSTDKATTCVMNVDVYDFDHMVFHMSLEEGIWEMETLVRLFQIFHRDEIREAILDPQTSTRLSDLINASRPISSVVIDPRINSTFPQIRPLRNKELFEPASLVKHTPLDVGDIFVVPKEKTTYVLLGQSCDLMVRSFGELAGKRANEHLVVPLVPLHRITHEEFAKKKVNHWKTHAWIDYFYPESNDIAEIMFSEARFLDVCVLDLSVLDPNGMCRLDNKNIPIIPTICTSGWKSHLENLINQYKEDCAQLDKLQKHVCRIKKQDTKDLIWQTAMAPKAYLKSVFDFGLQRVGRYRRPGADRLLKAYTQYLSRDADDLDYAKYPLG